MDARRRRQQAEWAQAPKKPERPGQKLPPAVPRIASNRPIGPQLPVQPQPQPPPVLPVRLPAQQPPPRNPGPIPAPAAAIVDAPADGGDTLPAPPDTPPAAAEPVDKAVN